MATSPELINPVLDAFVRIGEDIYIRNPPKEADSKDGTARPPATIVILFWMGASSRNAAKYLAEYVKLAPRVRIIFILTSPAQLFLRSSDESRRLRIVPAAEALLSSSANNEPLYFHLFSNGGAFALRHLAMTYRKATGKPLPAKALLMDSAPGSTSVLRAHKALSFSFPKFFVFRILTSLIVWAGLWFGRLLSALRREQSPGDIASEALNNPQLISASAKRCYLYSEEDDLIPWQDVERHAANGADRNYDVSCEKFTGSPHVSHMRTDPIRYWKIVAKYLAMTLA